MSAIERLYKRNNKTVQKCVNLDNELYEGLKRIDEFDATISDLINICVEDYIEKGIPTYYPKPDGEITTNRSIMLRKDNLEELKRMNRETGISVTRLLNGAIKEFLENYLKK